MYLLWFWFYDSQVKTALNVLYSFERGSELEYKGFAQEGLERALGRAHLKVALPKMDCIIDCMCSRVCLFHYFWIAVFRITLSKLR